MVVVDDTRRPQVPLTHLDAEEHRRLLAMRANAALPNDGSDNMKAPLLLAEYLVTDVPDATLWEGGIIYVSDETGGATIAFSDGTDFRRVTDRAIVS